MKILLICTAERVGGAAIAASRLTEALRNNEINALLLVRDKQSHLPSTVRLDTGWFAVRKFVWERMVIWAANRFRKNNLFAVSIANTGIDITSLPEFRQADVIHLHWINQGMLSLQCIEKILLSGKAVVWTMHDMWPATGICHHARECTEYTRLCGRCPFLFAGGSKKDLSYRTFKKKKALYRTRPITFVACSQWLEARAKQSALLAGHTVTSIPNPINTQLFKPHDRQQARMALHLPADKKLILFNSLKVTDKRKGIDYLIEACRLLAEKHPELRETVQLVILGKNSEQMGNLSLPFKVHTLSYIGKESDLVNVYNAVDAYVTPSLEDNLPNTIMEAMACGVPCIGFKVGGIPEMIDHLHNGYVAQYKSAEDFANGIRWVLTESDYAILSEQAVRKVHSLYAENLVAKRYIDLYNKITAGHA